MPRNNDYIFERNDSLQVKVPYYNEAGNRKFYSKSFKVKNYGSKQKAYEMARKFRDEAKVRVANDLIIKEKNYTLKEVYEGFMSIHQCSTETRRKYESIYRIHIIPYIPEETKFKTIKFGDIQTTLNNMASKVKNDTINRCFTLWKRLYKYAISSDYIMKDETYKVEMPKSEIVKSRKEYIPSYEDLQEAIDNIPTKIANKRKQFLYKRALQIITYYGLRPSECFALDKDSIDFENMKIHIKQRIGSTSTEKLTIVNPKTKQANRDFPIPIELLASLQELVMNAKGDYLFTRDDGKFISSSEASNDIHILTDGKFSLYSLRKLFATENRQDLKTLQEMMGHKEATMTLHYAKSNDEEKKKMIANRKINVNFS